MQAVIIATAVLHNIARNMKLGEIEPEIFIQDEDVILENSQVIDMFSTEQATSERQILINSYFNPML